MFEFIPADTPELLHQVFRLRHQVYCIENDFEPPHPEGLERDEYDPHSVHGLLMDCASQTFIGTVRLVLHKPGANLPFHKVCQHSDAQDPGWLPYGKTAEFSRFALSKTLRPRASGIWQGDPRLALQGEDAPPLIPHISIGLITAALRLAFAEGVTHVCAVMEPTLLRLLSRFGIRFQPLGPKVEYHGWRQPCYTRLETLVSGIERERRDVWEVVTHHGRLWPASIGDVAAAAQSVKFA